MAGATHVFVGAFLLKILATSITLETGGSGGIVTPIFFVGATSGAALAPFFGVPTTFLAAVGSLTDRVHRFGRAPSADKKTEPDDSA